MARQSLTGQGILIIEVSRSHSDTSHAVGLLWTSDQHDANLYLKTKNSHRHPCTQRDSKARYQESSGRDRMDGFIGRRKTHEESRIINGNCTKAETHTEGKNSAESLSTNRHSMISQKTRIFSTAVISSNLTHRFNSIQLIWVRSLIVNGLWGR